ncbi:MAG: RNA-binding protein [Flavipsychrobacter sp.]|nr:RNA-binding protein [Flavipsychrobacter sp.]
MLQAGKYHTLRVVKEVDFGVYLDGDGEEILLPKRFVPEGLQPDDEIEVFIYHDSENRLIATTMKPLGVVGDIVSLEVVSITEHGAFLKWGIMKDLFIPLSQQRSRMYVGEKYVVYLYIDERTGRVAATERFNQYLDNEELTVKEGEQVDLLIYRKTEIGYEVIINNRHIGLLYFNEVFKDLQDGDREKGYVKTIREDNKIDVALGAKGYQRIAGEEGKILDLLHEHHGYLPYHDKSAPEDIYSFFGMSKKAFKMAVGALYRQQKIELTQTGIKLMDEGD